MHTSLVKFAIAGEYYRSCLFMSKACEQNSSLSIDAPDLNCACADSTEKRDRALPLILWGMHPSEENALEETLAEIDKAVPHTPFILLIYEVSDWNSDLSPWEAPAVYGKEPFIGFGCDTLQRLVYDALPDIKPILRKFYGNISISSTYITGYSLAGLFALWALYETTAYDGAACCSGSLWFPQWDTYMDSHSLKKPCSVYLSLGRKEEQTRNAAMAIVGDRTRTQEELLRNDPNCRNVILEWNPGGHFNDPGKRLAQGIAWLLHPHLG